MASKLLGKAVKIRVKGAMKFVAADHFKTNSTEIKIEYLNPRFRDNFLQKVECRIRAATIFAHPLLVPSPYKDIIAELGDRPVTCLTYLWRLLERQPNGESGILPVDGSAAIFYILGFNNNLWAVSTRWVRNGWHVHAFPIGCPIKWLVGYCVFSR